MRYSRDAILGLADGLHLDPGRRGRILMRFDADDWPTVLQLANDELLTPALHAFLRDAGWESGIPVDVRDYLAFIYESNGARNRALKRQALQVIRALNGAGIRPLLLKGVLALLDEPRRDAASRIMSDLDFAVPAEAHARAVEVLGALGYRAADTDPAGRRAPAEFAPEGDLGAVDLHAARTARALSLEREGDPGTVDLHLELVDQPYVLGAAEVWSRARRLESEGAEFFAPSATDRVLHALLHAQVHHLGNFYRGWLPLRLLHDFAVLARLHAHEVDWPFIAERLAAHDLRAPLDSYLLAAHKLFGLRRPRRLPPPVATAPLHFQRCWAALRFPALRGAAVPVGNLWAAFAWHRMRAKYGRRGPGLLFCQLVHGWRFLTRHGASGTVGRLFGTGGGA